MVKKWFLNITSLLSLKQKYGAIREKVQKVFG
jgi:hypothetical protein